MTGDAGIAFDFPRLPAVIERALALPEAEREAFCRRAMERVRQRYSWDAVTDEYERLFRQLCR